MAKFRYKYLFFDPVNLLKEIKADASGAAAEYNRVRDVVRSRVRALDRAGFDYGDLGADLYKAPRASQLSDVQMAQGLSAMYNYVSRKTSTVGGKRESNRRRSESLKERGFNVEPWEVDAFGRFWDELRGNTEKRHIGSQKARDMWNPESEDVKKRMMDEISDDWDEWKDEYEDEMEEVRNHLEHLTEFTINYFRNLKKKYGKAYPRLTEIVEFESIETTKVVSNNAKLYANKAEGFVGTNLKKEDNAEFICDCSDLSEIIVIHNDGKYVVTKVSEKAFFGKDILYVGIFNRNDQRTIYNVIYREGKTSLSYAKRFAVTGITRDKEYDITQGTPGSKILWFTVNHNGEAETVKIYLRPRPKLKKLIDEYDFSQLGIKGRASRGNLVSKNPIQKINLKSKGISTIGGKDIWFDEDIQRLNEDGRGMHLGQFNTGDHILAIFKDGTYYTTSFDMSNRYQGDLLKIEKLDLNKIYTALYYDKAVGAFYVKRFSFDVSDNNPVSFIGDAKGSYLVEISEDKHPQFEITFGGKHEHREAEVMDAEEYIAKKGLQAKGKRVSAMDVKSVKFIEPLHKPEDDIVPEASEAENQAGEIDNSDVIDDIPSDDSSDDDGQLTLF